MRRNTIQSTNARLYQKLLLSTLIVLSAELLSWILDGLTFPASRELILILNMIYFAMIPSIAILWLNYTCFLLYRKSISVFSPIKKIVITTPAVAYFVFLLFTPITGWIFSINSSNFYQRGSLFFFPYALNAFYLTLSLIFELFAICSKTSSLQRTDCAYPCAATLITIAASSIQLIMPNTPIAIPCTAIAELAIYIHMQKDDIFTDALTGINNRGCFNLYLKNLLSQKEKRKSFCLFMLDLDYFKKINDTFGHNVGDEALIQTASTLTDFFRNKSHSFLARYGGDEFCAITRCSDTEEAEKIIKSLNCEFKKINSEIKKPYELSCSIGFAHLNNAELSPDSLIKQADEMMYKRKQKRKNDLENVCTDSDL